MKKLRVTVWNEYFHEQVQEEIRAIYPNGLHTAIAAIFSDPDAYTTHTATLYDEHCGLTDEVLNNTDVMIWWGHLKHHEVPDEIARKVVERVQNGMGLIVLHSGHYSKPFKMLMGTSCNLKWREADEKERLWVVNPSHPIASGLPEYLEIEKEETYGEFFDIPVPDDLVFVSWFSGGEVFRSGCCYKRGHGKIFYFRPGHEAYPTYYREDIGQVLKNAVQWAAPHDGPVPTMGNVKSLEA